MNKLTATLLFLAALFVAIVPRFAAAQELSEPEKNFEHLWKTYDRNYALFGAEVEFMRDDQGQVAKMLIRTSGQRMEAKRIK